MLVLFAGAGGFAVKQYGNVILPPAVDAVRSVIGPDAVAWIEATVYGAAETLQRWRHDAGLVPAEQAPWTMPEDTGAGGGLAISPDKGDVAPGRAATRVATTPAEAPTPPDIVHTQTATRTPSPTVTDTSTPPPPTSSPTLSASPTRTPRAERTATAAAVARATYVAGMVEPTQTPPPPTSTETLVPPTATPAEVPASTPEPEPASTQGPELAATPEQMPEISATGTPEASQPGAAPEQPAAPGMPASEALPTQPVPAPADTAAPAEQPAAAGAPESLRPFLDDGQLPGEGAWSGDGLPLRPGTGDQVFWKTVLRPNPERPYAQVYMVSFDPGALELHMVAGKAEPVSAGPVPRGTKIDPAHYGSLVAAFNGGWKSVHGNYGMMVDGVMIAPPQPNAATLAVHADGRLELGPWSRVGKAPGIASFRQNCPMLIDDGEIRYDKHTTSTWGVSLLDEMYVWRSGLGMTAGGRLIYAAGNPISAEELAWALRRAGAVTAMQLDINSAWTHWVTYDRTAEGTIRARPLVSTMSVRSDQYLQPVERDFFYLTWR